MSDNLTAKAALIGALAVGGQAYDNNREYVSPEESTRIAVEEAISNIDPVVETKTVVVKLEGGHHKADKYLSDNNPKINSKMTNQELTAYIKNKESFESKYLEQRKINSELAKRLDKSSSALSKYVESKK